MSTVPNPQTCLLAARDPTMAQTHTLVTPCKMKMRMKMIIMRVTTMMNDDDCACDYDTNDYEKRT